jgi:hypothetical protein
MDSPVVTFVLSFASLWISAQIGIHLRRRRPSLEIVAPEDLTILLTATLALLSLIIGFTFSMALAEYDQRKNAEQREAGAIGTEYDRAKLLPEAEASKVRGLLKDYLRQRILFYASNNTRELREIDTATTRLQKDLWSSVQTAGAIKPDPIAALVISGMNEALSSQEYAQAAWWKRIPLEAWLLMEATAICGNFLLGYIAGRNRMRAKRFLVLPLLVSTAFFLVADLDNPRYGVISVNPQNLANLSRSM